MIIFMKNYKITLLYTDIESLQLRKFNITIKAENEEEAIYILRRNGCTEVFDIDNIEEIKEE